MKKIIIIIIAAICVIMATVTTLFFFNHSEGNVGSVEALHINSEVVRLESDMSKRLSISTYGGSENKKNYELVSENEFVAVCEGDSVSAINEGETFVYAKSLDGKTKSNRVKIVVSNGIFEAAAKIIMIANEEPYFKEQIPEEFQVPDMPLIEEEQESFEEVEITPEVVEQITEKVGEEVPEIFVVPMVTDEKKEETEFLETDEKKQPEIVSNPEDATSEKVDFENEDVKKVTEKEGTSAKDSEKTTNKTDFSTKDEEKEIKKSEVTTKSKEKEIEKTNSTTKNKEEETEKSDSATKAKEKDVQKAEITTDVMEKEVEKSDSVTKDKEKEKEAEKTDLPVVKKEKTPEVSTNTENNTNDIVYITKSGKRFHLKTCASAKKSTPISRSEAISKGKTPCQKCKP